MYATMSSNVFLCRVVRSRLVPTSESTPYQTNAVEVNLQRQRFNSAPFSFCCIPPISFHWSRVTVSALICTPTTPRYMDPVDRRCHWSCRTPSPTASTTLLLGRVLIDVSHHRWLSVELGCQPSATGLFRLLPLVSGLWNDLPQHTAAAFCDTLTVVVPEKWLCHSDTLIVFVTYLLTYL